jgi:fructose/tagatose bisphosphate aldolase
MLISMKDMLALAKKRGHAVGSFNAINLEQAQGVIEAAVEEQVPVIISLDEPGAMYAGMGAFLAMVSELAREVPVPVSVMLDHVHDHDLIGNGVSLGYSGFLIDRRDETIEDYLSNLAQIKSEIMRSNGLFEIGVKIHGEDGSLNAEYSSILIDKLQPDSICVSINKTDRTNPSAEILAVLDKLTTGLNCPLSLAGIGRWPVSSIKSVIKSDVWKVSAATRLNVAFTQGLRAFFESEPDRINPRSYLAKARESYTREVRECIRVFASS